MKRRHFIMAGLSGLALAGLPFYWVSRWNGITIHHSAGGFGNLEHLRQVHRDRQPNDPINEIPYHFLVGNGNGLGLGEVVASERWRLKLWGAHLSGKNLDGNFRSIGICLIGNFETSQLHETQYTATVSLCRDLMDQFNIPADRVALHGKTPGEMTLCPGKNFPMDRLRQDIQLV